MIAGSILFFAIALLDEALLDAFTDYSVAILSFLPALSGSLLARRYGLDSPFGRCFALLAAGSALWFLGESLWPIHTRLLGIEVPFPSIMDGLWMIGYIFIGLGIYAIIGIFGPAQALGRGALIQTLCAVAAISAIIAILAPSVYEAGSALELLIYDYYLMADVSILGLISIVYRIFRGGGLARSWLIMAIGFAAITSADILFNLAMSLGARGPLLLSDLIYMNGYSLIALGFAEHARGL